MTTTLRASVNLVEEVLRLDRAIRYVAFAQGQRVEMRQRPDVDGPSAAESDRYEELLVNPALITLASQRGNIDCGGLEYLIVRYGNFFQVVVPLDAGHLSVAVDRVGAPVDIASKVMQLVKGTATG